MNGGTKVYLVKDRYSGEIVFFFALKAGLLYKDIADDEHELSEKEREIINLCIEYHLDNSSDLTEDDVFRWYEDEALDKDKLRRIIQERLDIKLTAKSDQDKTEEGSNIVRVSKTFPGIVLTHFSKGNHDCLQQKSVISIGILRFLGNHHQNSFDNCFHVRLPISLSICCRSYRIRSGSAVVK